MTPLPMPFIAIAAGLAARSVQTQCVSAKAAAMVALPDIPRLISALHARRADIVIGSRHLPGARVLGQPMWKRLLSRAGNALVRWRLATRVGDLTSGFRLYRAAALRRLTFRSDGFAF